MGYLAAILAVLLALVAGAFGFTTWRQRKRNAYARAGAARAEASAASSLAQAHAAAKRQAAEARIRENAERIRSVPLADLLRQYNRDARTKADSGDGE